MPPAKGRVWVGFGLGALGGTPQYQPGGPTRRQGLARRLSHDGQGLACAACPGGRP